MTQKTQSKDFSQQVARRIKELRTKQKLTQETLAFKAKMDTTSFSRIERRLNPDIRLTTLNRIIKALGVDYPTFLPLPMMKTLRINWSQNSHF